MSKTILANVDGFTPCMDAITQQYGVMVSAVFGRVWRYCQGDQEVCNASLETIADELRIGYATALRHVKLLVKDGYLKDLTPNLRYKPHTYADTGKAGLVLRIVAKPINEDSSIKLIDEADHLSKSATSSIKLIDDHLSKRQLKKEVKKEFKENTRARGAPEISGDSVIPEEPTPEERAFLDGFLKLFELEKFKSPAHLERLLALRETYGPEKVLAAAGWAAGKDKMTISKALASMETALPNWGSGEAQESVSGQARRRRPANEPASYQAIREYMAQEGLSNAEG